MDLYMEMLREILGSQTIQVTFPDLAETPAQLVDSASYRALEQIRDIIRDDSLDDRECFQKIEEIICVLESVGSGGQGRHDFS